MPKQANVYVRLFPSVLGRTLNCLIRGGVCKTLHTLLKGVQRVHDNPGFYGSWLLEFFLGSYIIGV
jgi:hypothetical protein